LPGRRHEDRGQPPLKGLTTLLQSISTSPALDFGPDAEKRPMWLFALVLGLLGGFNPDLKQLKTNPKDYFLVWGARAALFFVAGLVYAYSWLPPLNGPFWGLGKPLLVCWVINFGLTIFFRAALQIQKTGAKQLTLPILLGALPLGALALPVL